MLRIKSNEDFVKVVTKNECLTVESTKNGTSIYNATSFDKDMEMTIDETISETSW
jgi:hypothetical protein